MQGRDSDLALRRGIVLVILGVFFFLVNLGVLRPYITVTGAFGPYLVFIIGLVFLLIYFLFRQEWAVFPGSFATTVGLVIGLIATDKVAGEVFWPGFILAPGLSFFLIALLAPEHRDWAYIPGTIVSLVGLFFFSITTGHLPWSLARYLSILWPLILVVIGVRLLFKRQ